MAFKPLPSSRDTNNRNIHEWRIANPARLLAFAFVLAALLSLAVPSARADPSDGGGEERPEVPTSVRYIQADSQAEADRMFEEMDEDAKNPSSPAARAAKVKYGPCELEVQGVHFRQSLNYNSVGFKSYTKCDVSVTSITHYMRLEMKEGIYWTEIVPTEGTSNTNKNEAALRSKGTSFLCPKKSPEHWWSGHTKGVIVYKGETYYATGNAPVSQKKLECHA